MRKFMAFVALVVAMLSALPTGEEDIRLRMLAVAIAALCVAVVQPRDAR